MRLQCDWLKFFSKVSSIKNGDAPTVRMIKSDIISKMLEAYSDDLVYVNDMGNDFLLRGDIRIELKTKKNLFLTTKQRTSEIIVMNTRGGAIDREQTFDYLLLIQTEAPFRVAYISWEDLQPYLRHTEDACVSSGISYSDLVFVDTGGFFEWDLEIDPWDVQECIMEMVEKVAGLPPE